MRQLVQLKDSSKQFADLGAEVIAVFREDEKGEEGLKEIRENTKVEFTLAADLGAKRTKRYSPGKREFDNYVIDASGTIRSVIDGTLRTRAQAKQILEALTRIKENAEK